MEVKLMAGLFLVVLALVVGASALDDRTSGRQPRRVWAHCGPIKAPKNGRVKLRNRGRTAEFKCKRRFTLLGNKYSTCVNSRWYIEPPVCTSPGCPSLFPFPKSLEYQTLNGGAAFTFKCSGSGSVRQGPSLIYCNGVEWSDKPAQCLKNPISEVVNNFCDFENESLCGWTNTAEGDHFDWYRRTGSTSTHSTGPNWDHTRGHDAGHYMFIESSPPRSPDEAAQLWSPVFQGVSQDGCFVFWYHMYGKYMVGRLSIYVVPVNGSVADVAPSWTLEGDQGNKWVVGHAPVLQNTEEFQIVVEAVRRKSYFSDIALDDVNLLPVPCVKTTTTEAISTTTPVTTASATTATPTTTSTTTTSTTTTAPTIVSTTAPTSTAKAPTTMKTMSFGKSDPSSQTPTHSASGPWPASSNKPLFISSFTSLVYPSRKPAEQTQTGGRHIDVGLVSGVVVACVFASLAVLVTVCLLHRRRRRLQRATDQEMDPITKAQAYTY